MNIEELGSLLLFAGLGASQLERLSGLFEAVTFAAGAMLFAAGDRASSFYVVQSGEVVIQYHPSDGASLDIATIKPGGAFGWSAAFRRATYSSSAICRTDVVALTVRADDLHQIMLDDPEFARVLLEQTGQLAGSRFDSLGKQVMRRMSPKGRRKAIHARRPPTHSIEQELKERPAD